MKEALSSSETSILTRATGRNIPEDTILQDLTMFCCHDISLTRSFKGSKIGNKQTLILNVYPVFSPFTNHVLLLLLLLVLLLPLLASFTSLQRPSDMLRLHEPAHHNKVTIKGAVNVMMQNQGSAPSGQ
jgi:hypothetical protein